MCLKHILGLCSQTEENFYFLLDDWVNWIPDIDHPEEEFEVLGWKLNIDSGSWNDEKNNKSCLKNLAEEQKFFGYMKGEANGGIETVLRGSGRLDLKFGNCGDSGNNWL